MSNDKHGGIEIRTVCRFLRQQRYSRILSLRYPEELNCAHEVGKQWCQAPARRADSEDMAGIAFSRLHSNSRLKGLRRWRECGKSAGQGHKEPDTKSYAGAG